MRTRRDTAVELSRGITVVKQKSASTRNHVLYGDERGNFGDVRPTKKHWESLLHVRCKTHNSILKNGMICDAAFCQITVITYYYYYYMTVADSCQQQVKLSQTDTSTCHHTSNWHTRKSSTKTQIPLDLSCLNQVFDQVCNKSPHTSLWTC